MTIKLTALAMMMISVAGCKKATDILLAPAPGTAPATAASGYATPTSDLTDPTETVTRSAQLKNTDWTGTTVSQVDVTYSVSATGNTVLGRPEYSVTYNGTPIVIQWDGTQYFGTNGNLDLLMAPWHSTANGQASMDWFFLQDTTGGGGGGSTWGFAVGGFNSDPAAVAGLSGSATFTGLGGVSLQAQDDSFFTVADGPATLVANFNTNMISGTIDLTDLGSGRGGVTIAPNSMMILNPTAITANTFNGTASINPADFGLSSVGTISTSGMFYEAGATAVGGDVSGVGTATPGNGGGTAFLNGAFLANQ